MANIIDAIMQSRHIIYTVDANSKFTFINHAGANSIGFKNHNQVLAGSYDNMRCKASELCNFYSTQDQQVINTKETSFWLAIAHYQGRQEKTVLYGSKSPILDKNKNIAGVIGDFMDVTESCVINLSDLLLKDLKFVGPYSNQITYKVVNCIQLYNLSVKESIVLFYLLRGWSVKAIAEKLFKSPRTIETHTNNIKIKMKCSYKSELIEKSINAGLLNILPRQIIGK